MQCERDSNSECSYSYSDNSCESYIYFNSKNFCDKNAFAEDKEDGNLNKVQEEQRRRFNSDRRRSSGSDSTDDTGGKRRRLSGDSVESGRSYDNKRKQRGSSRCSYEYSPNGGNNKEEDIYEEEETGGYQRSYNSDEEIKTDDCRGNFTSARTECEQFNNDTEYNDVNLVRGNFVGSTRHIEESDYHSAQEEENNMQANIGTNVISAIVYEGKPRNQENRIIKLFNSGFRRHPPRNRILHDIYEALDTTGRFGVDSELLNRSFTGSVLIIFSHGDHIHTIHDRAYSNNSCRCKFAQYFEDASNGFGRRYNRRIIPTIEYSLQHWENTAKYSQKGRRCCCHLEVAGRMWIQSDKAGHIRVWEDPKCAEESMVAASDIPEHVHNFIYCGPEGSISAAPSEHGSNRPKENSERGKGGKGDEIILFLKRRPTSPLNQIFSSSAWLQSKYKFYDLNSTMIRNCIRIVNNMYNEMSTKQIYMHFQTCEPQHMFFNAPQGNISDYYYDVEESIKVLEKLLYFQFNNNKRNVYKFLINLYNIVDKLVPKKNSIFVLSPPNAGKNFFFDCVIHFYINFGQMGNFNRYCNFPMMECVDRRIILWNEPMMEPTATETLKMILGGDTVNAKVKYQNDAVITRTPVIILSNNDIFPKDDAFRTRMYSYTWKPCNFLKYLNKKPHPLAFYELLKIYKIIE